MSYRNLDWFASLDHGFNAPLALYWWIALDDGRFHVIREWKESGVYAEDLAKRFWKITRDDLGLDRPRYVVAGGDIDAHHGLKGAHGETVMQTLQYYGMPMRRADRDRKNGWYRLHELLRPSPYGTPWLTVDPSCTYLCRTLAAAPRDEHDEDELSPKFSDDHGLESIRYGAMSRPSPSIRRQPKKVGEVGRLVSEVRRGLQVPVLGSHAVRGV